MTFQDSAEMVPANSFLDSFRLVQMSQDNHHRIRKRFLRRRNNMLNLTNSFLAKYREKVNNMQIVVAFIQ